jgi:hypothetical protein
MNVYIAGSKPEFKIIEDLLKEQGHEIVPELSIAQAVAVVPIEDWPGDSDVLATINAARRQGKAWYVLNLEFKNFFEKPSVMKAPTRRRQVTLERRIG